jgi:hypothetical protein
MSESLEQEAPLSRSSTRCASGHEGTSRRLTAPRCSTSEQDRTADSTKPSRLQRDRSTDAGESLSDKFRSACATSPVAPGRAQ